MSALACECLKVIRVSQLSSRGQSPLHSFPRIFSIFCSRSLNVFMLALAQQSKVRVPNRTSWLRVISSPHFPWPQQVKSGERLGRQQMELFQAPDTTRLNYPKVFLLCDDNLSFAGQALVTSICFQGQFVDRCVIFLSYFQPSGHQLILRLCSKVFAQT